MKGGICHDRPHGHKAVRVLGCFLLDQNVPIDPLLPSFQLTAGSRDDPNAVALWDGEFMIITRAGGRHSQHMLYMRFIKKDRESLPQQTFCICTAPCNIVGGKMRCLRVLHCLAKPNYIIICVH